MDKIKNLNEIINNINQTLKKNVDGNRKGKEETKSISPRNLCSQAVLTSSADLPLNCHEQTKTEISMVLNTFIKFKLPISLCESCTEKLKNKVPHILNAYTQPAKDSDIKKKSKMFKGFKKKTVEKAKSVTIVEDEVI